MARWWGAWGRDGRSPQENHGVFQTLARWYWYWCWCWVGSGRIGYDQHMIDYDTPAIDLSPAPAPARLHSPISLPPQRKVCAVSVTQKEPRPPARSCRPLRWTMLIPTTFAMMFDRHTWLANCTCRCRRKTEALRPVSCRCFRDAPGRWSARGAGAGRGGMVEQGVVNWPMCAVAMYHRRSRCLTHRFLLVLHGQVW